MQVDEQMLAFIKVMSEGNTGLEFKVTLESGTQMATPGFIEEEDFLIQEKRRKEQQRGAHHWGRGRG